MDKLEKLSKIEIEILKVVDDVISRNKILNLNMLQKTAKKQLGYSDKIISKAIYKLILNKAVIPGKKITLSNVLENDRRNDILNYIKRNPGAHLREIRSNLNLNPQITNWHLKVLENFNFIRRKKYLKYRVFFPKGFKKELEEPLLALKNDNASDIFIEIYNSPDLDYGQIKKNLELAPNVVDYHVKQITSSGLVRFHEQDGKEYFIIDEDKFSAIQGFVNLKLVGEKIEKVLIEKPAITEEGEESKALLVKRAYDYVGGNIRFKVVLDNQTDHTFNDLMVSLNVKKQYELNRSSDKIEILEPGESRGVDFMLTPLTCGRSRIYGIITYLDKDEKMKTIDMQPAVVQIKCPLVQPKMASAEDLLKLKESLQKSHAEIKYSEIKTSKAFQIAREQVSSLDVSEVKEDKKNYYVLYSGQAKIGGDQIIIELKMTSEVIILDVYLRDIKQATGFLAYINNLINLSLEYSKQITTTLDKITNKIYNAFEFGLRLSELFELCEKKESIDDVLLLLKELEIKSNSYFPDLFPETYNKWLNDLEKIKDKKVWDRTYLNLKFDILKWYGDVIKFSKTNSKNYFESPSVEQETRKKIEWGNAKLDADLAAKNEQYSNNILYALMVLDKQSGLSYYNHNFTVEKLDSDLVGGFLTAIQSFGMEFSKKEKTEGAAMKSLAYEHFEISLLAGKYSTVALVTSGFPDHLTEKKHGKFLKKFESKFQADLEKFTGNVGIFSQTKDIVSEVFS